MTDLSLYEYCLLKTAMRLRDGMYDSCLENPFSSLPSKIISDLLSKSLSLGFETGWTANNLRPLLTSGKLTELKIDGIFKRMNLGWEINQLLHILTSSCQKLQVLHLYLNGNRVSMRKDIEVTLGELLNNCPSLKEIRSDLKFDLTSLRNCRNLRVLSVQFKPRGKWSNFLAKEDEDFQKHDSLEYFSVSYHEPGRTPIKYEDIVTILQNCPELTSLGYVETSGALSLLQAKDISPLELKLRHCFWSDRIRNSQETRRMEKVIEAIQYYPVIEELDIESQNIETISNLRNLRNLVYLNITLTLLENKRSISEVLGDVLKEIGSQLKHLSFYIHSESDVDISLILKYCTNLKSLRSSGIGDKLCASSPVHLPHLSRLTIHWSSSKGVSQTLPQIFGCNQLTDLFIPYLDEKTLKCFLKNNTLSNLQVACLKYCSLTESNIEQFLLNAPKLEKVYISDSDVNESHFKTIVWEINHKIIFDEYLDRREFFEERSYRTMFR